jgi:hypothetical protein
MNRRNFCNAALDTVDDGLQALKAFKAKTCCLDNRLLYAKEG